MAPDSMDDSKHFEDEPLELMPANLSSVPLNNQELSGEQSTRLEDDPDDPVEEYRLYKARFAGLVALVFLSVVSALSGPWFGPIANNVTADFHFTLDQVNWLGLVVTVAYLPSAFLIPSVILRFGIRLSCGMGAIFLVVSAWIRYIGITHSQSSSSAYGLLILASIISAVPQAVYQVMGPTYSEKWFDLQGRTTATMIVGVANPVGNALGQLLSPLLGNPRQSILILAIISTAVTPLVFLVGESPPTPPTFAATKKYKSMPSLVRAMLGQEPQSAEAYMSRRERIDFAIITIVFGILVAATTSFSVLSAQLLEPYGYSDVLSGLVGAAMLLIGLLAAIITAPLFDRVFTHQLAMACKIFVPLTALSWFSLIWAVRPNNTVPLFIIAGIIGMCSIPLLPVAMELACELTRNTDGSAAIVWIAGNLCTIVFVLVLSALRAGPDDSPPLNMRRSLTFLGAVVVALSTTIFFVRGEQKRKALDELKLQESLANEASRQNRPVA